MLTGLNASHLREFVVRPVLRYLDPEIPYSLAAENLVMGTAAQESRLHWLDQLTPGPGPAYGLWQMEERTYNDHWKWIFNGAPENLEEKMKGLVMFWPPDVKQLHGNLFLGAAMCRIHYRRSPLAIPDAGDTRALGQVWKTAYNTVYGKGTVDEFVAHYEIV